MPDIIYDEAKVKEMLASKAPSKPVERQARYVTFHDPGYSINELRTMFPDIFYEQTWYANEAFASEKDEPTKRILSLDLLPGSTGKTVQEQQALLQDGEDMPSARIAITGHLLHFLATGECVKGLEDGWLRTSSQTAVGVWVDAYWHSGRLDVSHWSSRAGDRIGSGSVRASS